MNGAGGSGDEGDEMEDGSRITLVSSQSARPFLLRCEADLLKRLKMEIRVQRVTSERVFLYGAAKRTLAQAEGFRAMQDAHNATVAASLVRLQLDTLLRLYALWWVHDPDAFSSQVFSGKQINKLRADDGALMTDAYLYRRLAAVVPWIETVYKESSGFVHFSDRHIQAVLQIPDDAPDGHIALNLSPTDKDRPENYFNQLAASFTDVTMRIAHTLDQRFNLLAANPTAGTAFAHLR